MDISLISGTAFCLSFPPAWSACFKAGFLHPRCRGRDALAMPQTVCNKSVEERTSSLAHQCQHHSPHHIALGLPCSKDSFCPQGDPHCCAVGSCGMWPDPCQARPGARAEQGSWAESAAIASPCSSVFGVVPLPTPSIKTKQKKNGSTAGMGERVPSHLPPLARETRTSQPTVGPRHVMVARKVTAEANLQ